MYSFKTEVEASILRIVTPVAVIVLIYIGETVGGIEKYTPSFASEFSTGGKG